MGSKHTRRLIFLAYMTVAVMLVIVGGMLHFAPAERVIAQDGGEDEKPVTQPTGNNSYCLLCHSQPDQTVQLADGTILNLTVTGATLADSVHGINELETGTGCVDCHGERIFPHENRASDGSSIYAAQAAAQCMECHTDSADQLVNGTHAGAVIRNEIGTDLSCVNCHGSHEVNPVEEMVCVDCHMPDEEWKQVHSIDTSSITVSVESCETCHSITITEWQSSAHGELQLACATCHLPHERQLRFESTTALCLNCHTEDRYDFTHLKHLGQECADCHWYGGGSEARREHVTTLNLPPSGHDNQVEIGTCVDCHGDEERLVAVAATLKSVDESHPLLEAQVRLGELEEEVEIARQEGEERSSLRLFQSVFIGLAIGGIATAIFRRYIQYHHYQHLEE